MCRVKERDGVRRLISIASAPDSIPGTILHSGIPGRLLLLEPTNDIK